MDTKVVLLIVAVIVVLLIVYARVNRPKRYRVKYEKVADGVNVEKCSKCGAILSQGVHLESGFGGSFSASTGGKLQINGEEVCPNCGVKLQR